ncbi:hypothetical protein [Vibrio sp. AH4]|uniref:hypothetical protein n=1 Tax=Vibrio sp. AH4 TaxID=2919577 RepID=UPI00273A1AC0|nr:hypothetical protein [Vibrio sp. AH4]MDP4494063.1 hypothetical protein [Vibrio sp. AH4]
MIDVHWSYWDKESTVRWNFNDLMYIQQFSYPPIAVSVLTNSRIIAISCHFEEFGSNNLNLFTFDGTLIRSLFAPAVGDKVTFGALTETSNDRIQAQVCYYERSVFKEQLCYIELDSGECSGFSRGY